MNSSSAGAMLGRESKSGPGQPKPGAPRPKKIVREPRWSAVPLQLSRSQVEDRFFVCAHFLSALIIR